MRVPAECLVKAWDSNEAMMYEPGGGTLPGGLYEIDTENAPLNSMTTHQGKWVFQYPGHIGGPDKAAEPAVAPVRETPVVAPKADNRKVPMSAEHKAKLKAGAAAARAAKKARLEAA